MESCIDGVVEVAVAYHSGPSVRVRVRVDHDD